MNFKAWSFSALTAFETCAKQYYHVKVAKDIKEVEGEAATWGKKTHKHFEDRIAKAIPLPDYLAAYEGIANSISAKPGTKLVEYQMAITSDFKPTEWFAKDVWCRGIVDAGVLTSKRAAAFDWKTGKRKPESDQLRLFAGLMFAHFPNLEVVDTAFVWIKENKMDRETVQKAEVPIIWQEFAPRVARMKRAFDENRFPPNPSGLCRKWCPVPKHICSYSGKS